MRQKRAAGGDLVGCGQDGLKMVFDMVGIVTITRGVVRSVCQSTVDK
nr:MAG TPA: hypothetical protein [Caudoviricetes sp.]